MLCSCAGWWKVPNAAKTDLGPEPWGRRTLIMGTLNVTPDSFSGDGIYRQPERVLDRARQMVADGADILDVGGESTRPHAVPISETEEVERVLPVVEMLRAIGVPISVDTSKAGVAQKSLAAGAVMINDVSGLADPRLARVVAESGAYLVVTDNVRRGDMRTLVPDIVNNLRDKVSEAQGEGVAPDRILVDPGFGFGKGWRENFAIMRGLTSLRALGKPVLVGPSRKGMIGKVLGLPPADRVEGTIALTVLCIAGGADVVRVHDVQALARAARVADAIIRSVQPSEGADS